LQTLKKRRFFYGSVYITTWH